MISSIYFALLAITLAYGHHHEPQYTEGPYYIESAIDGSVITATEEINPSDSIVYYSKPVESQVKSEELKPAQIWNIRRNWRRGYKIELLSILNKEFDYSEMNMQQESLAFVTFESWTFTKRGEDFYELKGKGTNSCLQYNGVGQRATKTACTKEENQMWLFVQVKPQPESENI